MHVPRLMNGLRLALGLIGAVFTVTVPGAGVARADGPVQLKNGAGDFCLDQPNNSIYPPMMVNPCDGSSISQRWNLLGNGQIQSAAFPGMCLGIEERDMWARYLGCANPGDEVWVIQPDGLIRQGVTFSCLTPVGDINPGTWVSVRLCNGDAPEQQWAIVP
jgi:Ricin-type beta-trefoil lectin domain